MKLSICMMVKNEEKNLERCLESLNSLREHVDNELIIIDTGSNDRTIEIANKYTDKVHYHEWNNNFSEMRNITISYASGNWILIIDADEELVQVKGIIDFFKKGVYLNYAAATLKVENVVNKNGKVSSAVTSFRLFKKTKDFKYEGVVHNMPQFKGLALELKALIKHYGYMSDDSELMEEKFSRTSKLLINELEKDETNLYYRYQLGITYSMYGDYVKARETLKEAYFRLVESKESIFDYVYIVAAYAKILSATEHYEEAIEVADVGLKLVPNYIDLIYFKGVSNIKLKKFEQGIKCLEEYLMTLNGIEKSDIYSNPAIQLYTIRLEDESRFNLGQAYFMCGDYENSKKQFFKVLNNKKTENEYYNATIYQYIKTCVLLGVINEICILFEISPEDRWAELDRVIYECINEYLKDSIDYIRVINALSVFPSELGSFFTNVKLVAENNKMEIDVDYYSKLWNNKNYSEVIYIFMKLDLNVFDLLKSKKELEIMKLLGAIDFRFEEFSILIEKFLIKHEAQKEYKHFNVMRLFSKYIMIKHLQDVTNIVYFDRYITWGLSYINYKYRLEFIDECSLEDFANSEEQYLISIWHVLNNNCRQALENALNIFQEWNRTFTNWLSYRLKIMDNHDEFDELGKKLKMNIESLIEVGRVNDALLLIDQYTMIQPDDLEIVLLKSKANLELLQ